MSEIGTNQPLMQPLPTGGLGAPSVPPTPLSPATQKLAPTVYRPKVVDALDLIKELQKIVSEINEQVKKNGRGLNFSVDERLGRPIVIVRNTDTGEVVRQIPNEVVIKVAHSLEDMKGLLLDSVS